MKEMKKMKENDMFYIHKSMLRNTLDTAFWEVMNARIYYLDELINSDYMDYALDMAHDNNDLKILLDENSDNYIHPYIARKISLHYKAVEDLMADIRCYLLKNYDIDYYNELTKRQAKKEGK